jgi:nucleotide-binding universal stress UspA family protein
LARKALEQGLALAKALNAKVTAVTVTEPWGAVVPAEMVIAFPAKLYDENVAAAAAKILAVVADAANTAGVACETRHAKDQFAAAEGLSRRRRNVAVISSSWPRMDGVA